jgi:hypothetical protein
MMIAVVLVMCIVEEFSLKDTVCEVRAPAIISQMILMILYIIRFDSTIAPANALPCATQVSCFAHLSTRFLATGALANLI